MPEWREVHTHQITAQSFLKKLSQTPSGTELLHLWADAGDSDKDTYSKHVFRLGPNDYLRRGGSSGQTLIAPAAKQLQSKQNPAAKLVSDLTPKIKLSAVHSNGKAIFLDFSFIYLKVCRFFCQYFIF